MKIQNIRHPWIVDASELPQVLTFAPPSAERLDEFEKRLAEALAGPQHLILLPSRGPTVESSAAGLSARSCPTWHANTVPVELAATGEKVATLCVDCDRQLPADWATA